MPEAALKTMRNALVVIAVVVCGATVWWMRGILTPLVLAIFLMMLIDGLARVLEHRIPRFPHKAAMPVALIVSIALFGLTVYFMVDNTRSFIGDLIGYGPKLHATVVRVATSVGVTVPSTLNEFLSSFNPGPYIGSLATSLQNIAEDGVFVLIYLGFLIASRHGFARKIVILFPSHDQREKAVRMFNRIRLGVERYVWVQTVTGLIIAAFAFALMTIVHLDNALFWAFFVFVAAYIPMLGAAVTILAPALFALVQFDTYWQAIAILAGMEGVHFFMGNIVVPKMQGESLNLDPVVILLSLAFWSAIWGLPGAFLSSPLTVVAMVILAQFASTRWIAVLLSEDGAPEADGDITPDPSKAPTHHPGAKRKRLVRHTSVKP